MTRIIKFRGYAIKDKKWIDGDLQHYNNSLAIIPFEASWIDEIITPSKLLNARLQVEPKSVGQFTGLHDKNGVEIYEGDILIRTTIYHGKEKVHKQVVEWKIFEMQGYPCAGYFSLGNSEEIIGNIHQNPELLCP